MSDVVRTEDHVHVRQLLEQTLAVPLPDASADSDQRPLAPAGFERLERGHLATQPFVGVLANAARHEDDDIRALGVFDGAHRLGAQQPGDAFGVVLVHLAPEGADQVGLHGAWECSTLGVRG